MLRKTYYIKLLINLYKKFLKALVFKKSEKNTIYLLVEMTNFYNFVLSLHHNSLTQTKTLNDICIIDYPEKLERFELSYNLLSVKYNFRFFIKSYTSAYASSLSSIFNSAN
jgi:NADH:ubiquinone oxidoreductase subunit C